METTWEVYTYHTYTYTYRATGYFYDRFPPLAGNNREVYQGDNEKGVNLQRMYGWTGLEALRGLHGKRW
jgi:hypothetical protein